MWSVPLLPMFLRATPRKRLWLSGGMLGVFLLTLGIGNCFVSPDRAVTRQMLGHDFLPFYAAGSFVRQNRAHDLYNLTVIRDFEQATARTAGFDLGKSYGPWWNPPFYALMFEPLAELPYSRALNVWRLISLTAATLAIVLLCNIVAQASLTSRWQHWMMVPVLMVISMPFIQAFSHGQNTFTSLLMLTGAVFLWRKRRGFAAGVVVGLLFFKPQLGAVVTAVMVVDLGWTAFAGVSMTGIALLLTTLIAMPGSLSDWLHQMPINLHWMQIDNPYAWERHVTLKAFWRLLLQGGAVGKPWLATTALSWISLAAIGGGLVWAFVYRRNNQPHDSQIRRDRLIAATITAMPLLMPFYFDYDLLLLAIPATLYAANRISYPDRITRFDAFFTANWVLLFLWVFVNPAFALSTHLSGTVLLLGSLTIFSINRINRVERTTSPVLILRPQPTAMAA